MSTTSASTSREGDEPTQRYERLLEVQSLMARVSREIGPALHLDHVLRTVLRAARSIIDFNGGRVCLLDEAGLYVAASEPPVSPEVAALRLPIGSGITGAVVAGGASINCPDVRTDERVDPETRMLGSNVDVVSYLAVPLVCLGDVIGTIQVDADRPGAFDAEDVVLLEGLATQVGGAIESARRYEMISELEVLKSDFIARVSHELRTPITIMAGFVSTLLANHERLDGETRQRMLERIDVATARLSGLIDELLMLSRLEAGVVAAQVETVSVSSVLSEVRRQSETPEAIAVSCARDLRLETDPALLIRAVGFLVDNALKYAGSCELRATDRIIEVIDRGPGISPDQRSRVFERFTRANENTTVPGMGIGLPMARTLLAAAGADLSLEEPEDGVGTRMVIRFW
jgi:putative methionine-R-sulfoxide reductase with GAF domain